METKKNRAKEVELSFSKSKIYLYVFVILLFCFIVYYFAEIKGDVKFFVKINPAWLALAFAAQFGTYLFNSILWRCLLNVFTPRSDIRIMKLFQASIVTQFINQTI